MSLLLDFNTLQIKTTYQINIFHSFKIQLLKNKHKTYKINNRSISESKLTDLIASRCLIRSLNLLGKKSSAASLQGSNWMVANWFPFCHTVVLESLVRWRSSQEIAIHPNFNNNYYYTTIFYYWLRDGEIKVKTIKLKFVVESLYIFLHFFSEYPTSFLVIS